MQFKIFCITILALSTFVEKSFAEFGETTLVRHPGFVHQQGPAAARGVIVWSPGYKAGHPDAETGGMPHFLDWLYGNGWDLFYMERTGGIKGSDRPRHARAIRNAVSGLKSSGYQRIVLGGQSSGGTYSLIAAQQDLGIHGMLLIASGPSKGPVPFTKFLQNVKSNRVAVVHFANDKTIGKRNRDPIDQALRSKQYKMHIYEPTGLKGHSGGFNSKFSNRFGDCILSFIDGGTGSVCDGK